MKLLKKIVPIYMLVLSTLLTYATGGTTFKYTPVAVDDLTIMIPYASVSTYTPPVNSLEFTNIVTTEGKEIRVDRTAEGFIFKGYEGKIVLLEVYGDTCPHCIEAIPAYNRLQAKYPDDVVIIALESYGTLTNAGLQQYITIPEANTGEMFSFIKTLTGYYRQAVPYLMILDRDGAIFYDEILADFPESTIDNMIQNHL